VLETLRKTLAEPELAAANVAEALSGWPAAVIAVAIAAAAIALYQIRVARRFRAEATAQQLYRDYLRRCFDHPAFAEPPPDPKTAFGPMGYARYQWFVAMLLWAAEEISSLGGLGQWRDTLTAQMRRHGAYFASDDFSLAQYSPAVRRLVRKVLKAEGAPRRQ
jgi:hypothetical protein